MELLALIGILALLCVGVSIGMAVFYSISEWIEDKKYEYNYKHRFDKSPTAKCYCVDCKYYNVENHRCYGFHEDSNRLVADSCFCYRAEPRERKDSVCE